MVHAWQQCEPGFIGMAPEPREFVVIGAYQVPIQLFAGVGIFSVRCDYGSVDSFSVCATRAKVPTFTISFYMSRRFTYEPSLIRYRSDYVLQKTWHFAQFGH